MADNENHNTETPAQEPVKPADAGPETGWKAEARKWEQRAKASYERVQELEPLEAKVAALEDASKSDLQKAQERADAAEKALAEVQARAVRTEVAAAKGVPAELLSGDSKEALEASADAIIAFRDQTARKGNYAPSEGRTSTDPVDTEKREFVRNLFATND